MASSTEQLTGAIALPKVSVDAAGGSSFTAIAELSEPGFPDPSIDVHEVTHTDITNQKKTYKPGWIDEGPVSFTFNYREDTLVALRALMGVDAPNWKIEWTDPTHSTTDSNLTFLGQMTSGPTVSSPNNDKWTIAITVQITGAVTYTEGT
jgi:hypothetical protein